jgi:prenyltransferase beta subunit
MVLCLSLLVVLPLRAEPLSSEQKKATLQWVRSLQQKDGGFLPAPKAPKSTLRGTSAALRSLKYFGSPLTETESCQKFVLSCRHEKSGGFADQPGQTPDVVLTAVALMAMVELKLPTDKFEKAAMNFMADGVGTTKEFEPLRMTAAGLEAIGKKCEENPIWVTRLMRTQNPDGTFGKGKGQAREIGGVVACILRLGGKLEDSAVLVKALNEGQRKDGGFGTAESDDSDLETSYRVVRSYVMLKAKPARVADLTKFIGKCRNSDGGYGVKPGQPSTMAGTYFASILLHWLEEK